MHLKGIEWLETNFTPLLKGKYELKRVSESDSDLGALEGLEFNSDEKGGYIFFWSTGYVGYQFVDYQSGVEVVKDSTEKLNQRTYEEVFQEILDNI